MGLKNMMGKTAEKLHLKKRDGHIPTAGASRTIPEDGETPSGAAAPVKFVAAGPAELGGAVGTRTVPGYAAPGTPLNDPESWEGPKVPPISGRFK